MQVCREENHKRLLKDRKELNKWRERPCSGTRGLSIAKRSIPPKLVLRTERGDSAAQHEPQRMVGTGAQQGTSGKHRKVTLPESALPSSLGE